MAEITSELRLEIVGRDAELALLEDAFCTGRLPRALVLTGGPGIGKTTIWESAADLARRRGLRVLSARGSGAEMRLSFTALIDLLHGVGSEELASLPPPQLHALEVALLRDTPSGGAPEPYSIPVALTNSLRALAARDPVLVAVDDVQWLDAASADALAFAARRLDESPVSFLLARRPGRRTQLELALERRAVERLEVGPLSLGAMRRLLSDRLGLNLPRHVLRRLFEVTLGNPLFALEVGRALSDCGLPAAGEDFPVTDAVDDLLGTRVAHLSAPVQQLLLAAALNADLKVSQLAAIAEPGALEDAVESGVLVVDGEHVRAAHPLLAAAAARRSRADGRRRLHRELASVVTDPELRAHHLALATTAPDEELAATVAAAAASASSRGARQEAAELAGHALRLTPPGSSERGDRVLALAGYLHAVGELQRVTDLLTPELELLPPGEPRVRAWLLLSEGGGVTTLAELQDHLEAALAESGGDAGLRAQVLANKADYAAAGAVADIRLAEAWALEALEAAPAAGPHVERAALSALTWARSLRGRPVDDLCARFAAVPGAPFEISDSPGRVVGQRLAWRGEPDAARATFAGLLALADERGEAVSYALIRLHLCELELRLGGWEEAEALLDEWAGSADGELLIWPMYERCRALLAAGRGLPAEAEEWAAKAIARAEEVGGRWDLLEALRARGTAALLAHEPARAAESLRAVWDHLEREGVEEPGAFPVAPELVEALQETGELEEAAAVTGRLRQLAEEQEHPWALAVARRCTALAALAAEPDEDAAADLREAVAAFAGLGLRFDRARTLLCLGRAQRRLRKWGAARSTLEEAEAAFAELGSPGWADEARSELERVGGRRPLAAGALTPAEGRVAELAAEGLANKQIASALHVTVRTVEVHLKHVYAKLGIRSRSQLARRLSESP